MRQSTAAIIKKQGLVLLAKRKPGGSLSEKWEFPGGKVDPGESPEEALTRELFEEFEIKVTVGPCLATHEFSNHDKQYQLLAFETHYISGEFVLNEHTEYRWVKPEEISRFDLAPSDRGLFAKLPL